MKKSLAVIGIGSAGILSLSHFCSRLNNDWDIVSIYDPQIKIIGIGESTNPAFIQTVELGLNFSMIDDLKYLDATYKFATRYIDWKNYHIDSPLLEGRSAIHFNNFKLKEFAFERLSSLWPEKFKVLEGSVTDLENIYNENLQLQGARVVVDDCEYLFDYVIDCRGFPKDYSDYVICDKMPVNHCLVHNKQIPGNWNYTGHRATQDGWMFEIPLTTRQSYGYLFNTNITEKSQAKKNFSSLIDVPENELDQIEYSFKSYYSTKAVDGRILKNGNRFGFFEPMSATSMYMYSKLNRIYSHHIDQDIIGQANELVANQEAIVLANNLQDLICFFYHGGSKYDTEFWRMAVKNCTDRIKETGLIEYLKSVLEPALAQGTPFLPELRVPYSARSHINFDRLFEHNYITK